LILNEVGAIDIPVNNVWAATSVWWRIAISRGQSTPEWGEA